MLSELLKSPDALRHGIANDPTPAQLQSIALLTQLLLEPIRVARGPIVVSSGLRDPMVNAIVGGQPNSAHLYGHAADIEPQNCSIREVIDWLIHSDLLFDEVIFEGHWVHVARMGSGGTQRRKAITLLPGPDGRRIASPYDPHDPRLST